MRYYVLRLFALLIGAAMLSIIILTIGYDLTQGYYARYPYGEAHAELVLLVTLLVVVVAVIIHELRHLP
jgi:hypothetical protein